MGLKIKNFVHTNNKLDQWSLIHLGLAMSFSELYYVGKFNGVLGGAACDQCVHPLRRLSDGLIIGYVS